MKRLLFISPTMSLRHGAGLAAALLWTVPALAGLCEPQSGAWFDCDGKPTERAQQVAALHGMPKFVEGAPIEFPMHAADMREPGCLTIEFTVRKDGLSDEFVILDASPKDPEFEKSALRSLKFWRFEPDARTHRVILPIVFQFDSTGSHIPRLSPNACVLPKVGLTGLSLRPQDAPPAHYPPPLVSKRVQGCATVAFTVTDQGLADDYGVVDAQPDDSFILGIAHALNEWRFDKALAGKQGIARFDFSIPELTSAPSAACKWPNVPNLVRTAS